MHDSWPKLATWQLINWSFRVTFICLLSLFKRLLCRLKVLSAIIFILSISSHLILVLCFFSRFVLLKLGCVLHTHIFYMPSNMVLHKKFQKNNLNPVEIFISFMTEMNRSDQGISLNYWYHTTQYNLSYIFTLPICHG